MESGLKWLAAAAAMSAVMGVSTASVAQGMSPTIPASPIPVDTWGGDYRNTPAPIPPVSAQAAANAGVPTAAEVYAPGEGAAPPIAPTPQPVRWFHDSCDGMPCDR